MGNFRRTGRSGRRRAYSDLLLPRGPIATAIIALSASAILLVSPSRAGIYPDWTHLPFEPYPLFEATPDQPVLSRDDVPGAALVADPFLFFENGTWYLFFEAWIGTGCIGLATSNDCINWTYDSVVISEPRALSYPYVFAYDGEHYIVQWNSTAQTVYLYQADDFPHTWHVTPPIVTGRPFRDASIFFYDDTWWMFASGAGNTDCYLYYSDNLMSGWSEHPMSPIVRNDAAKARPGGRCTVYDGNRILRFAQKCDVSYGEAVRAFEITVLDRQHYSEVEIGDSPVLQASGHGWNARGMHTCDPWWSGDHWVAAVDGYSESYVWSIGIYRTSVTEGTPPDGYASGRERIVLDPPMPNPSVGLVTLRWTSPAAAATTPVEITIHDVGGRCVRRLAPQGSAASARTITWDATDASGTPLPSGTYYCRALAGGEPSVRHLTIVR